MDFDPGFHEEMYDEDDLHDSYEEGLEDEQNDTEEPEETVEFDAMGNPIYIAVGVGFGYEMAQREIDERQIAEDILKNRAREQEEPIKVPLSRRHEKKGHMTPFARWATNANIDPAGSKDEIDYTIEERLRIMESEGDWDG